MLGYDLRLNCQMLLIRALLGLATRVRGPLRASYPAVALLGSTVGDAGRVTFAAHGHLRGRCPLASSSSRDDGEVIQDAVCFSRAMFGHSARIARYFQQTDASLESA